ncbi:hypothetical protein HTS61_25715 [Escherichia coli]|nr:hypothetical protein [Escherichia coli]
MRQNVTRCLISAELRTITLTPPAEIQCFFEESALVIIDYQQAIENGFVRMTQRMVEIMHGGEEEEYA